MNSENKPQAVNEQTRMSWGALIALALLAAIGLGAIIYFLTVSVP